MEDRPSHERIKRIKRIKYLAYRHKLYWKNRVVNRAKSKARRMLGRMLGIKGGYLTQATYKQQLAKSNEWNKSHRQEMRIIDRRYKAKIVAKYGSHSEYPTWLWVTNNQAKKAKKRKAETHEAYNKVLQLQKVWRREIDRRRRMGLSIGWRSPNKASLRGAMAALMLQVAASVKKNGKNHNGEEAKNAVSTAHILGRKRGYAVAGRRKRKRKSTNKS